MEITIRTFFKISGATAIGTWIGGLGFDLSWAETYAQEFRIKGAKRVEIPSFTISPLFPALPSPKRLPAA